MVTIDQVKAYSRIDAEDETIQTLLDSASSLFASKGIKEEYLTTIEDKSQYNLGLLMLIDHWYNNRGVTTEKSLKNIPLGIKTIMFTLQAICKKNQEEAS